MLQLMDCFGTLVAMKKLSNVLRFTQDVIGEDDSLLAANLPTAVSTVSVLVTFEESVFTRPLKTVFLTRRSVKYLLVPSVISVVVVLCGPCVCLACFAFVALSTRNFYGVLYQLSFFP